MKILISNDDGIFAPGIEALVRAFANAGHEIIVCAPDGQRSAMSQALTIGRPLIAKTVDYPGASAAYAISGTPADCVKLGLSVLCPDAQAVISGINHGYNVGTDVLYSGTIGAAMEGALCGRQALAVSLAAQREDTYDLAAQAALEAFAMMQETPLPPHSVMNVNYPAVDRARGLVAAPLTVLSYLESYQEARSDSGETTYSLSGYIDPALPMGEDDYSLLLEGYATMTVLTHDMTHHQATEQLKKRTTMQK